MCLYSLHKVFLFLWSFLTDPSVNPVHSEEKLNHDAQELEKRLSMLSHRNSTSKFKYVKLTDTFFKLVIVYIL